MGSNHIIHPQFTYHASKVLEALRKGKATIAQLATRTGYSRETVSASLLELQRWHLAFPTGGLNWQSTDSPWKNTY